MNRQNPSYSGQPRRSTGSSTHHKSSGKQYTMYREPPEKDPKRRRRRSTDGVTAAQLSKFIVPALLAAAAVFLLLFFWQWTSYQKSDEEYQTLRTQLVWMDTSTGGDNAPASRLDFTALKEQNPDVTAWLSVQGLELSLPVVPERRFQLLPASQLFRQKQQRWLSDPPFVGFHQLGGRSVPCDPWPQHP